MTESTVTEPGRIAQVTRYFLHGVRPAVIALILHSCYRLARLGMDGLIVFPILHPAWVMVK